MTATKQAALLVLIVLLVAFAQSPSHNPKPPQPTSSPEGNSNGAAAKLNESIDTYQRGDYANALAMVREVIAAEPREAVAYLLAARCSLRLKDYSAAIKLLQQSLQLQPGDLDFEAGLLEAYSVAGMSKEADEERKQLRQSQSAGSLPANFHFEIDFFEVANLSVRVVEYFPELGRVDLKGAVPDHYRYWFFIADQEGRQVEKIVLQALDADQSLWKKNHPKEAAAGQRMFSLDGYNQSGQRLLRFYDGEPIYTEVREAVKQDLLRRIPAIRDKHSPPAI